MLSFKKILDLWYHFDNDEFSWYIHVMIMAKELVNIAFVVTRLQLRIERYIFRIINKAKYPLIQEKEYPEPDQLYKHPN